jgi:hypothetical protein
MPIMLDSFNRTPKKTSYNVLQLRKVVDAVGESAKTSPALPIETTTPASIICCLVCSKSLKGKRSGARYCSNACTLRSSRSRRKQA